MSKSRRKVTVDTAKSVSDDSEKRKPSVFERLGPGGGQRKYDYEAERMEKSSYVEKCRNWLLTGSCSFGSKCKFLHGPYSSGPNAPAEGRIRSSKRHESENTDDIKLKLKSPRDKGNDRKRKNETSCSTEKRSHSKVKHEKDGKIKSTVVVRKPVDAGSEIDSEEPDEWSEGKLFCPTKTPHLSLGARLGTERLASNLYRDDDTLNLILEQLLRSLQVSAWTITKNLWRSPIPDSFFCVNIRSPD